MQNLFDSAQFLLDKGAFINEPIQVGKDKEPVYFYLMKNNPSLVFSPMFMTLIERADLKLIKRFRYSPKKSPNYDWYESVLSINSIRIVFFVVTVSLWRQDKTFYITSHTSLFIRIFSLTVTWFYLRHLWYSSHSIYETHSNVDLALLQRWSHVHWFYEQLANRSCRETDRAWSRHYSSQWRGLHLTGQLACPGTHDTSKRIPIFMTALVDWTTSKIKI